MSGVPGTAKVIIGGKIITLGGYESEEYFQKVASYINKKMDELSAMPGYSRQPMETKHTLISLNITDDYFKAKKQAEVFEQDLQQKDQEMYDLKHELISLRMQIEEAQKHEQEALEQKSLLEGKNKELEKQIDNDIDRLIAIKKDVIATIECLNAYEYDVLHIVYIQGKTLHDVADYYGRSYSWILSIHRAALKHVQDILDAEQRQRIESMCKSV